MGHRIRCADNGRWLSIRSIASLLDDQPDQHLSALGTLYKLERVGGTGYTSPGIPAHAYSPGYTCRVIEDLRQTDIFIRIDYFAYFLQTHCQNALPKRAAEIAYTVDRIRHTGVQCLDTSATLQGAPEAIMQKYEALSRLDSGDESAHTNEDLFSVCLNFMSGVRPESNDTSMPSSDGAPRGSQFGDQTEHREPPAPWNTVPPTWNTPDPTRSQAPLSFQFEHSRHASAPYHTEHSNRRDEYSPPPHNDYTSNTTRGENDNQGNRGNHQFQDDFYNQTGNEQYGHRHSDSYHRARYEQYGRPRHDSYHHRPGYEQHSRNGPDWGHPSRADRYDDHQGYYTSNRYSGRQFTRRPNMQPGGPEPGRRGGEPNESHFHQASRPHSRHPEAGRPLPPPPRPLDQQPHPSSAGARPDGNPGVYYQQNPRGRGRGRSGRQRTDSRPPASDPPKDEQETKEHADIQDDTPAHPSAENDAHRPYNEPRHREDYTPADEGMGIVQEPVIDLDQSPSSSSAEAVDDEQAVPATGNTSRQRRRGGELVWSSRATFSR